MHEGRHVVHVVQNRDVFELHGVEERLEAGGVFLILARQKDKVHVLEAAQEGECAVHLRAKANVRLRQTGTGHHQHNGLVSGEIELLEFFLAIVVRIKPGANGDACNADFGLGNFTGAKCLGHKFVGYAEQVGVLVGPKAFDFIVCWYADDRIIDTRDDAGTHSDVGRRDVCRDHGYGPAGADIFVEGREHNT